MIEFNVGDSVRYLPCMHIYHVEVLIVSLLYRAATEKKKLTPFFEYWGSPARQRMVLLT